MADLPQLSLDRHRDLRGRERHPLVRRAVILVLTVLVLAALAGAIGQQDRVSAATGAAATLHLTAPARLRGGLLWHARIEVRATRAIMHPRFVLGAGWSDGMQLNAIEPAAMGEASRGGRLVLSYAQLAAGDRLVLRLQAQVDPTTLGRQDLGVEVDDATTRLAATPRTVRVLP